MSFASEGGGEGSSKAPKEALTGSLREYRVLPGTDLVGRVEPFFAWQDLRRQFNLWPYAKSTATAPKTRRSPIMSATGLKAPRLKLPSSPPP